MHSIAFRILAEDLAQEHEQEILQQRINRRNFRDAANPLELPNFLFQKYYRVNKPAFIYLLEELQPAKKQFAVAPIVKLSACLRFFAEGAYQTGVGKDHDVALTQPTFSKVLSEVLNIFETHLCPKWIRVPKTSEEKRKIAAAFYVKHNIPGVIGCIDRTHVRIIAPKENKHIYYNRKGYYSLNVMLVS
ncbi:putative nuclease HARBI1 [Teleopsis dalmanni]|uniref:putative nuclease HARBI1 n=1 Tax=Teleopsis dalmanni TaxID=139649 RepID=UPI0018CF8B5F|nr:putative nuclease HARBI1 [Teleopsis dalmanni]